MNTRVTHFYDPETGTFTYVVNKFDSSLAIVIDPVLDYDPASCEVKENSLAQVLEYVKENSLELVAVIETHAHADHLSSSQSFKKYFPNLKVYISERIKLVQEKFKDIYEFEDFKCDGHQFDYLVKDYEEFELADLKIKALPTPGHTPACMSYLIGKNVFTGDSLFVEDSGTGRCDFPGGSACDLYESVMKNIYSLPDDTAVYVGHDYGPNGRDIRCKTTVGISKLQNTQLKASTNIDEYCEFRNKRDKGLKAPRLLFQSIQVNINGGKLPRYLKMPMIDKRN